MATQSGIWVSLVVATSAVNSAALDSQVSPAVAEFTAANPGVSVYMVGGRVGRIFGPAFAHGHSPARVADAWVADHAGLFGVAAGQLRPSGLAGAHIQPLMFDPDTGAYMFTLVTYRQTVDGVPVFRADLRLLVRN